VPNHESMDPQRSNLQNENKGKEEKEEKKGRKNGNEENKRKKGSIKGIQLYLNGR